MRYQEFRLLFILLLSLQSLFVFGESKCIQSALDKAVNRVSYQKIWTLDEPVTTVVDGKTYPITYSFDSEISYADGLLVISEKQEWLDELNKLISEIKIGENGGSLSSGIKNKIMKMFGKQIEETGKIDLMKMPVEEIAKADGRSIKQFLHFGGLRKGVPKDKEFYAITDLSPATFDIYMNTIVRSLQESSKLKDTPQLFTVSQSSAEKFINGYKDLMDKILVKDKGLPVNVTRDMAYIELPHSSYENTPKGLRDTVEGRLHEMFKWRSTHLHIGLPGGLSEETMGSIARAVESRIILEMAVSSPRAGGELYATSFSTLRDTPRSAKKSAGVIRLNYNRHEKPFRMHDLEVRNYLKLKEGFNHIALASRMGEDHGRVIVLNNFRAANINDPYTSNLNGALKYVGEIAKKKGNEDLGRQMVTFAERIESEGRITDEMRKEVHHFLKENDILKLLEPEFFLD